MGSPHTGEPLPTPADPVSVSAEPGFPTALLYGKMVEPLAM
jgi:hypothetical protein